MKTILVWSAIIGVGWVVIQILPTVLPIIGYAIVGLIVIAIFSTK